MASLGCSQLTGTTLRPQQASARIVRPAAVQCRASSEQNKVLGVGAALFAAATLSLAPAALAAKSAAPAAPPAKEAKASPTDLIGQLKEKSESNKDLNNKKRLATSYANFAQSRTVQDGTCAFPYNLFGCDEPRVAGRVKFITEDREIECQGKPDGKCASKFQAAKVPSAFTSSAPQQ